MKPATIVLEEILRLLSDSQSLTVDELAKATDLSARVVMKALDLLATGGLIELKDDRVTIDPALREIMFTEERW
jgi:DNA-binding transcriptional ArsR family regulator